MGEPMTVAMNAAGAPQLRRIQISEPVVAGVATFLAVAAIGRYGLSGAGVLAAGLAAVLVVLSAIDLRERRLPNVIVLPATAVMLVGRTALDPSAEWIVATLAAGAFMLLPQLVRPGSIGMGDVKLAALIGAAFGVGALPALTIGLMSLVPVVLFLLVRHGAAARNAAVPLGPFLALGALVILFAGGLSY